jgi:hypothetical protein
MLLRRKDGSPIFGVLKIKYEGNDYEESQLLILAIFIKTPRIIFTVLHFEITIS